MTGAYFFLAHDAFSMASGEPATEVARRSHFVAAIIDCTHFFVRSEALFRHSHTEFLKYVEQRQVIRMKVSMKEKKKRKERQLDFFNGQNKALRSGIDSGHEQNLQGQKREGGLLVFCLAVEMQAGRSAGTSTLCTQCTSWAYHHPLQTVVWLQEMLQKERVGGWLTLIIVKSVLG
ncbi:hypothetical protein BCR43DRAFT_485649 [Syncephalastrum racemosum]|uniref:Uncharacterized protein n=1 Tax=Syncephalastrum racemosum TaxID=13706 RepID=A0A1X2HMS2_SYNRA|nr:hypothetical protein BCR43DRAFT_485649 [Syncephalastrum racemosum]